MKKKIAALAAIIGIAIGPVIVAEPAQAVYTENCWAHGLPGFKSHICVAVTYTRKIGGGFVVQEIEVAASDIGSSDDFESNPAVDGHSLILRNNNGAVIWSQGEDTNISCGVCYRIWSPGLNTNRAAQYLDILYAFTARYDWANDADGIVGKTFS